MISFIVVACLMLLIALAFVLLPLLRARTDFPGVARLSDAGSNVAVFRSQKREIEDDFARGVLSDAERDAALVELSQRLVDEVPGDAVTGQRSSNTHRRPWLLAAMLGALIPAAAFMIYAGLGAPQALREGGVAANAVSPNAVPGATDAALSDKQILAMVDTLAQKMQQNPGDPKGWVLLARSQNALGRYAEAVAAFERAAQLLPNDSQLMADYADAMVLNQQGRFEGKPVELIKLALKLDPNNMKGIALAGTAELRLGNREASLKHWGKLKTLVAKDSDDYRQVEAIIAEIQSGKSPVAPAGNSEKAVPAKPAVIEATPASSAKAGGSTSPAATVSGQVLLAPELAAKLAAGDTLFVFARAKQGPRMPLAVMRVPAPKAVEFPKSFELTDAMAMAPGLNLSSFPEVVIEARISKSGNAQLQTGDLSGVSEVIKPGTRNIKVNISKVAP